MEQNNDHRRFKNAREVLPPALFAAVQKAVGGRSTGIWVPGSAADAVRARARRVVELKRQGVATREIAVDVGLTERRVQQIIAANRGEL